MDSSEPATIRISTDAAASAAERVDVWRDVMRLVGDIDVPLPQTFAGQFTAKDLGDMRTVCVTSSTYRVRRTRTIGARLPREHVILNLLEQGAVVGKIGHRTGTAHPGDVTLSRSTNDLELTFEDAAWLGVLIPRPIFDRHLRWRSRFDGFIHRAGSVQAALLGGLVRSLCSLPDTLSSSDITRATTATLSLATACLGDKDFISRDAIDSKEATAKQVRRYIVRNLSNPMLDIDMICTKFGMSRSAMYRIMDETGPIAATIRLLRLHAIVGDMSSTLHNHEPLAAIARRWGFADERNFRRAFRREFDCPPSTLRGEPSATCLPGPVSTVLNRWFLGCNL